MAEQLEGRVGKLEDRAGTTENKVGNLETAFTGLEKMTDERHLATTKAVEGNSKKLTLVILMLGTGILGALLTLIISLVTK